MLKILKFMKLLKSKKKDDNIRNNFPYLIFNFIFNKQIKIIF